MDPIFLSSELLSAHRPFSSLFQEWSPGSNQFLTPAAICTVEQEPGSGGSGSGHPETSRYLPRCVFWLGFTQRLERVPGISVTSP